MKRFLGLTALALGITGMAAVALAQLSTLPFESTIRYALSCPTSGFFPGQICVDVGNSADPIVQMWNSNDDAWEEVFGDSASITPEDVTASDDVTVGDALAVTGATTLTGTLTANGAVTLGSNDEDNIILNGPMFQRVFNEQFSFNNVIVYDITNGDFAASVADNEANLLFFPGSQIGAIYYRNQLAFGGTYAPGTFLNGGKLLLDSASILDVADNDAIEYVIGGAPVTGSGGLGSMYDEDNGYTVYCEAEFTIATIAQITTDDFYFGLFLNEAIVDTFAVNDSNTYAMFIMSDNAGDLDMETELNGGGTLNDDAGYAWVDAATKTLRVAASADAVTFWLDGVQLTQTNAVLDFDNSDTGVCRVGIRSSGTAAAGVSMNHVEIGLLQ